MLLQQSKSLVSLQFARQCPYVRQSITAMTHLIIRVCLLTSNRITPMRNYRVGAARQVIGHPCDPFLPTRTVPVYCFHRIEGIFKRIAYSLLNKAMVAVPKQWEPHLVYPHIAVCSGPTYGFIVNDVAAYCELPTTRVRKVSGSRYELHLPCLLLKYRYCSEDATAAALTIDVPKCLAPQCPSYLVDFVDDIVSMISHQRIGQIIIQIANGAQINFIACARM